jgi:hypothetical protein
MFVSGKQPSGSTDYVMQGVMEMKEVRLAVLLLTLGLATGAYTAELGGKKKVTFTVTCFDVGASTLQGQPGVIWVQKGWLRGREVNRVTFDPKQVSVEGMEAWLRRAGTYIGTEPELSPLREKEK